MHLGIPFLVPFIIIIVVIPSLSKGISFIQKLEYETLDVLDTFIDYFESLEDECMEYETCQSCNHANSVMNISCAWNNTHQSCTKLSTDTISPMPQLMSNDKCEKPSRQTKYSEETAFYLLRHAAHAYQCVPTHCPVTLPNGTQNISYHDKTMSVEVTDGMIANFSISGYIAIDIKHKRIIVSFMGSDGGWMALWIGQNVDFRPFELIKQQRIKQHNISPNMKVISSVYQVYEILFPLIYKDLVKLHKFCPHCDIMFTGHSLGGSLASIAAFHWKFKLNLNPNKIWIYTFGEPRAFNYDFSDNMNKLFMNQSYRIVYNDDVIPHILTCHSLHFKNINKCTKGSNYRYHHGIEIFYKDENFCDYTECLNEPFGEDPMCSNNKYIYDITHSSDPEQNAHMWYYQILRNGGFCDLKQTAMSIIDAKSCGYSAVYDSKWWQAALSEAL